MSAADLASSGVKLWLMGHAHTPYDMQLTGGVRAVNAGTPEPDGFGCAREAGVAIVDITADGAMSVTYVAAGAYRFVQMERELGGPQDIAALEQIVGAENGARTLLSLTLRGRLAQEEFAALGTALEALRSRVLFLADRIELADS